MGIAFKISKKGARYQPKARSLIEKSEDLGHLDGTVKLKGINVAKLNREVVNAKAAHDVTCIPVSSTFPEGPELPGLEEYDVSFTLNLFQRGYIIGKPTETENLQPLLQDGKSLHPYDRVSVALFSGIQTGSLPGDILDDIPSKFINGMLVCEVRDYRKCLPEQGTSSSASDGPSVNKVQLRMSHENVVKDIPLLSDDTWTYGDLMEVESRIVKALQPQLYLDPTPKLERLCADPYPNKLNLGIGRKRQRHTPEVTITSNSQTHGKKVCINGLTGNDNCKPGNQANALGTSAIQGISKNAVQHVPGDMPCMQPNNFAQETARSLLPLQFQGKFQPAANFPVIVHDCGAGSLANCAGTSANISSPQSFMGSYSDTVRVNVTLPGKRDNPDAQIATMSGLKRQKQMQGGLDGMQQQQLGSQFVGLNAQDMNWKNQLICSQLDADGSQYSTVCGQRYPPQTVNAVSNQEGGVSFYINQQGMRYGPKEEQIDTEKLGTKDVLQAMARENNALDQQQSRAQHLLQQSSMRNHLPPNIQGHNSRVVIDNNMRKDDVLQKRKTLTSPRVSSGPMVQSPVSSKSGEISSGSVGQFSAVAMTYALGSQKAATNSNAAVGAPSTTSSPNDSVHRQPQKLAAATKRKSNSATKTQGMSGVGSPASVSTMNPPLNASSPSTGTASMGDQIERFGKIDMVTQRHQLNRKRTKVEQYPPKKAVGCPAQHVAVLLKKCYDANDFTDETKQMSRSLVGGNINICKIRTMEFTRNEPNQAVKRRLVMAENPFEGTVIMQYGDADGSKFHNIHDPHADGSKFPNIHDPLLTLHTTNHADLLAAQFCILIEEEGYQKSEDQIQTLQSHLGSAPTALTMVDDHSIEVKREVRAPSPLSNMAGQTNHIVMGSPNPSHRLSNGSRILAPESNNPALPISQGYFPRPQQLDQPSLRQQQLQQQQQLQLPQIPRSSSMLSQNPLSQLMGRNSNLGSMNANQMVASKSATPLQLQMLQQQQQQQQQNPMQGKVMVGLNNMVGLGGLGNIMGMGGLQTMPGLSYMQPNQMSMSSMSNFGTGIHHSSLSTDQAAAMRQVHQSRAAGVYGGIPGSMISHAMNRANISQMQRGLASMYPPKIPGQSFYHQQQQQMQQQHLQQQLNQQQQQQISSPLQQSQMGSPSMVMSPQLSSGALHQQMNNNNNNVGVNIGGVGPASPQLSSSITSSPMEQLPGPNKGGNA